MSWQEDLQELDNALASGKITADEYRLRRDQVLANASSPQQPQPQQPNSPFPEPFKWNSGPDATQVVQPGQQVVQPGQADRTQVVPQGQPQGQPQQQARDADRTQYVQPVTNPRPDVDRTQVVPQGPTSGGFPAQPQPDWSGGASAPPWGGTDFGGGDPWGTAKGPEVFEDDAGGGKGKVIAVVLVVVLVVGLGFGAYMIWGRDSGTPGAGGTSTPAPSTTTVTTTTPPKRTPEGPFIEPPGKLSQFKTLSMADALATKQPTLEEAQLLQNGGTTEVRYVVARDEATKLVQGIWAFQTDQPDALLTAVDGLYAAANFQAVPGTPTGVIARNLPVTPQNPTAIYRAHYVVDDFVVRVETYGPDEVVAKAAFDELLQRQLDEHPPTS